MTTIEKEKIRYLRGEGLGYKAIASKLQLSVDAVKGFCRRNGLDGVAADNVATACRQCGVALDGMRKRFCSQKCGRTWWRGRTHLYHCKEKSKRACDYCGRVFYSFPSRKQKYCGHPCYVAARFGGGST